jgi:hypothetical protein
MTIMNEHFSGIRVLGGVALGALTAVAVACSAGGSDKSLWQGGQPPPSEGSGGAGGSGGASVTSTVNGTTVTVTGTTTTTVASTTSVSATTTTTATTTTVASSTAASSSSSSGGGVTWTQLYTSLFGQGGTATCVGSSCHTFSHGGFTCGTSKTSCYNGFVSAGWINPGSGASQSPLVDPSQSCLCGSLGGNMPKFPGQCPSSTDVQNIKSWLATGAPDN